MATHTSVPVREEFVAEHQAGFGYRVIASKYNVSLECVRYWCRKAKQGESLESYYRGRRPGLLQCFHPLVRYVVLRLRLSHPGWGPSRIHYHLGQRPSLAEKRLPGVSQIGRYLHQWKRFRRATKRDIPPVARPQTPTRVHQCWQVDFKLGIALANGTLVNLHTVHDPVGEVCILARVTAAGTVGHKPSRVSLSELQHTLRAGFARWQTLPEEIQTDGEPLFVGNVTEQFPSQFTLWLVGLGIRHRVIRPGKPTDNAEVERCHRTLNEYALLGREQCTLVDLQSALDQAWHELVFVLPSQAQNCAGQPPVVAHPDLLERPRPYQPHTEISLFDLSRVDAFLAQFSWQRIVGKTGQVSLGGQHHYYSVGRIYANQLVSVHFDPTDRHFAFALPTEPHLVIARRPARYLSIADLLGNLSPQQLPLGLIEPHR